MKTLYLIFILVLASGCSEDAKLSVLYGYGLKPKLPEPTESFIPTIQVASAVGWPEGKKPTPAPGIKIVRLADNLDHPRWLYVLPNNDLLVAETDAPPSQESGGIKNWLMGIYMQQAGSHKPSANRITLLRDADNDGIAEIKSTFLENLNSPFGIALINNELFIANADNIVRYPYEKGVLKITGQGTKLIDLPSGINHHWTKNIIASEDGKRVYVSVGSNSNIAENGMDKEVGRAAIWEVDIDTGKAKIFAQGLRNPNGMAWTDQGKTLWAVVNERDEMGHDLVPDYLTSVKKDGFYGWPYSYFGANVDIRVQPQRPDLVKKAIIADYALGSHTASLGLVITEKNGLPKQFQNGAFIGQHGSWNRIPFSGYKVIFVPFNNGSPSGMPIDILTGFLSDRDEAYGRPVGVTIDKRGTLFVADDVGNTVWGLTSN
ncbi:MAG: sorbosone dehydrogenase family protein [Methyloglobulus sp.]|nr:sorbosone dehydrogenase family protein [Methyloglobulus sp.]